MQVQACATVASGETALRAGPQRQYEALARAPQCGNGMARAPLPVCTPAPPRAPPRFLCKASQRRASSPPRRISSGARVGMVRAGRRCWQVGGAYSSGRTSGAACRAAARPSCACNSSPVRSAVERAAPMEDRRSKRHATQQAIAFLWPWGCAVIVVMRNRLLRLGSGSAACRSTAPHTGPTRPR